MRFSRFIAVFALMVALVAPVVLATQSADAAPKPKRHFVYAKIIKLPSGDLSFRAQIAKYPNGSVSLMRKDCVTCTWHRTALKKTTAYGRVFTPVGTPPTGRWYFRYLTPATPKFALTHSATWYTYRH